MYTNKYMRAVCKEDKIRLFSENRTRGKRHKTETLEVLSEDQETLFFFTVMLIDH